MKITKQRLKEIIKEELTMADYYAAMETDEPKLEGGTPEERLLNRLMIASKVSSAPNADVAAEMLGLDGDEEVIAYLDSLMGNPMYEPMEEYRSTGTGGQSKKDREKPARPSSDTRSSNSRYRG